MGASLLLWIPAAWAQEPIEVARSPGQVIGQTALASADWDGDGLPDIAASVTGTTGESGVTVWFSSTGTWDVVVTLPEETPRIVLEPGDLDTDGNMDLAVGAPELTWDTGSTVLPDSGTVWVWDPTPGDSGTLQDASWMRLDGKEEALLFGTGLAIGDLNQDGFNELFVGAPGWATDIGMIFMYDRAATSPGDQTDALNTWIGRFQEILGMGAGVEIITVAGAAYLVSTACDFAGNTLATSCTEPAGMSAAIWESSTYSAPSNITGSLWNTSHMGATTGPIHRVPGEDALIVPGYPFTARWDMSTPSSPYVAGPVVNAASAAAAPVGVNPNTGSSGAILRHGDDVSRVEDFSTVQPIADVAVTTYTVSGEVLGQQIAPVADWDGDGCDDALVSSEGGEAIWLIPCPALPVDTGDTGDSDTDTGDSDTDTGDSDTDTADSDSDPDSVPESDSLVDTDDPDTDPPVVCEPEFGWSCSGGGSTGAALMLLGLGLLARRRERQP